MSVESLYWVDMNGDDMNDGSFDNPFKTISHALAVIEGESPQRHGIVRVGSGKFPLTSTLLVPKSVEIIGSGSQQHTAGGTELVWNGATGGGTMPATTLTAACGKLDLTIQVSGTSGWTNPSTGGPYLIVIDREWMQVTQWSGPSNQTWTVTRVNPTATGTDHLLNAEVAALLPAVQTALSDNDSWVHGIIRDLAITYGNDTPATLGSVGLNVRNAQNDSLIENVRVGDDTDFFGSENFFSNEVLVHAVGAVNTGFFEMRGVLALGGRIPIHMLAGVTTVTILNQGIGGDARCVEAFRLDNPLSGAVGFDLTMIGCKCEMKGQDVIGFHFDNDCNIHAVGMDVQIGRIDPAVTSSLQNIGGNVNPGVHKYVMTITHDLLESMTSRDPSSVTADTSHGQVLLTFPAVNSFPFITARTIYRTKSTGPDTSTFFKLVTIMDGAITSFTDNTADSGLTTAAPTYSTKPAYSYTASPQNPKYPRMHLQGGSQQAGTWLTVPNMDFPLTVPVLPTPGAVFVDSFDGIGQAMPRRVRSSGTGLSALDFAITGWGTAAIKAVTAGSTDQRFELKITAGASGTAGPTIVLTFRDGTWGRAPFVIVARNDAQTPTGTPTWAVTATTLTITMPSSFTPGSGKTYIFEGILLG
jgi:hypothetical protein